MTGSPGDTSLATLRSHSIAGLWAVCRSMCDDQQMGSLLVAEEQCLFGSALPGGIWEDHWHCDSALQARRKALGLAAGRMGPLVESP